MMDWNVMDGPAPLVTVGRGGVTARFTRGAMRSGYVGHDWARSCGPNTVVIDSRTIPDEHIARYACVGPMVDPELPPGVVDRFTVGEDRRERWEGAPVFGRDARVGNAGPLDFVSVDVQAAIARRFGATVTVGELPSDVVAAAVRAEVRR